ncbi:MAG: glycosyltransferase [Rhodobacteraceae bacterium]|nr:MAG: glycosyltransferase [Paracoccaceae bacterium]
MIRAAFAVPGDLSTPTGGYAYARRLLSDGPAAGLFLDHLALPGGFPHPDAAAVSAAAAALAAAPADRPLLVDGLAFGALPAEALAVVAAPLAALVHHPLALESGLDAATAARLAASERAALGFARAVVTPSAAVARTLVDAYGVAAEKITVAAPGLDPAAPAAGDGDPPHILCVGSLSPRKAQDVLIAALTRIAAMPWRATLVGAALDPTFAAGLAKAAAPLGQRVTFLGALDAARLDAVYASADIFCLPSRYEGYGMVYAEAMARALPVVAARHATAEAILPAAAAALVPPGDAPALAEALAALLDDPDRRARMGAAGRAAAAQLPGWDETVRRVAGALQAIAP